MDKYKMVLKKRIIILAVFVLFALTLTGYSLLIVSNSVGEDLFAGNLIGFQCGLSCSLLLPFIFLITRYRSIMNNETKLRKLYNWENDERKKEIKQKSGANVILFCSVIIIFAGIIAGYFNEIVFYSLIGCAFFLLHVSVGLKLYYTKKYQ